ncbi:hypothetical protein [Anaerofustis sp.]|uniref:hypothetical protein n=1 Tax=Anaerofustis sp. TaxID=1872517 RepID=UPI0025C15BBD|nr:hypothetical protein [Anaerofustis sp.]
MQIHIMRKGETIDDLCRLYSVCKSDIIEANELGYNAKLSEGENVIIPGKYFYYFKPAEESFDDVLKKFHISKEDLYLHNETPLSFKDGSVRLKMEFKRKDSEVYSLVDLSMNSKAFIEADLESKYLTGMLGYNCIGNDSDKFYFEDYYLKKIHDIDRLCVSPVISNLRYEKYDFLIEYIENIIDGKYYLDVTLYYDITEIDIEYLFELLSERKIKSNFILDFYLLEKVLKDDKFIDILNKNANKVFILPNFINDYKYTSSREYYMFLNKLKKFDKDKVSVGLNLNYSYKEDIINIMKKVEFIYDLDFKSIVLFACGNRFFKMGYVLNYFFNIKKGL